MDTNCVTIHTISIHQQTNSVTIHTNYALEQYFPEAPFVVM